MSDSPNVTHRFSLKGIIGGLMCSDNLGDVYDEILFLHDLAGIPRPEGSFVAGWTRSDRMNVTAPEDREGSALCWIRMTQTAKSVSHGGSPVSKGEVQP